MHVCNRPVLCVITAIHSFMLLYAGVCVNGDSATEQVKHLACHSPCVLCHNDAQPLNFVLSNDGNKYALYTMHSALCTLHYAPYTVHPTPRTLHCAPYTVHSTPRTLHCALYTTHSTPRTLHHAPPYTTHPTPHTLHYAPYTMYSLASVRAKKFNVYGVRSL